jgi:predicted nucleotidyltransferase
MLVGAHCRDILHAHQGHSVGLLATDDVDFGVALHSWTAFEEIIGHLEAAGHTGVRFTVGGVPIDLMPFGDVERPAGMVTPPSRDDEMISVWAFREVFDRSHTLTLPTAGTIRIPTIPGYVALKLAAWLDRSTWGKYKDAGDVAAAMHWYAESDDIVDRLYADDVGEEILVRYDVDPVRGALHLLGQDVADLIGPERTCELEARWPGGSGTLLLSELNLSTSPTWPSDLRLRRERLNAFENGLGLPLTQIT